MNSQIKVVHILVAGWVWAEHRRKVFYPSWIVLILFILTVGSHFFEPLCVRRSNKVGLHIVNSPLWVHQVLVLFSFNLDHAHDDTVNHVDRLTFFIFSLTFTTRSIITFFNVFDAFAIDTVLLSFVCAILNRRTTLVDKVIVVKLLLHVMLIFLLSSAPRFVPDFIATNLVVLITANLTIVLGVQMVLVIDKVVHAIVNVVVLLLLVLIASSVSVVVLLVLKVGHLVALAPIV